MNAPNDWDFAPEPHGAGDSDWSSQLSRASVGAKSPTDSLHLGSGIETTGPPTPWIVAALIVALGGLSASLATDSILVSFFAWLCSGPVAIGLIALFTSIDSRRQAGAWYAPKPSATWMRRLAVILGLAGVMLNAITIAFWVARR
jgi:hypothetical protein